MAINRFNETSYDLIRLKRELKVDCMARQMNGFYYLTFDAFLVWNNWKRDEANKAFQIANSKSLMFQFTDIKFEYFDNKPIVKFKIIK